MADYSALPGAATDGVAAASAARPTCRLILAVAAADAALYEPQGKRLPVFDMPSLSGFARYVCADGRGGLGYAYAASAALAAKLTGRPVASIERMTVRVADAGERDVWVCK
jgi:hypothetical protein